MTIRSAWTTKHLAFFIQAALLILLTAGTNAASANLITVSSKANLSAAGQSSTSSYGDGELPSDIAITGGVTITFPSITGMVYWCRGDIDCDTGPEGEQLAAHGGTHIPSWPGESISIAEHDTKSFFLAGVFLDSTPPTGTAPPVLRFANPATTGPGEIADDFLSLVPSIGQVFFIGDGMAGNGTGPIQEFVAPDTARHLHLGFLDADNMNTLPGTNGAYEDNLASFLTVNYSITQVPEPTTLGLLAAGLLGLGFARRRGTPAS